MHEPPTTSPALLTKALLRAADQLDLSAVLPALLDTAPEEVARLRAGERLLDPERNEWQGALGVVGLFRTMIELLGTAERARAWLGFANDALGARPIDLLRTPDADRVSRYVSAVRKHELRMPPAHKRER